MFDSGLLLSSDFRKTFVSKLQDNNNETEQIRKALVNFKYTSLNDPDKLLLAHDLGFIFIKEFYDFDHGCLFPEKSQIFRSNESLMFFPDYLLYFSFISSLYDRPNNADLILSDISSLNSRKVFFTALREPLSPYLFVTFIHNLIDSINLGSPDHDSSSIEFEMCRQLIINAKELSQLDKFIELHKILLEKIKSQYKNSKKTVTKEMESSYSFFFAHAFYDTIVYPSNNFKDPSFKDMSKNIFQILHLNSKVMNPIIEQFSDEKDLLSYHTYLFQRVSCIQKPGCWVHQIKDNETFLYPAQLRLTIMSKKVGDIIGCGLHPIGNSVVKITFPVDSETSKKITVSLQYNKNTYTKKVSDGIIELVLPCYQNTPLEISFLYQNKKNSKNSIQIPSLQDPPTNKIIKKVKFDHKEYSIEITHNFYNYDKPINDLTVKLDNSPSHLFDFITETFVHKYFSMNAQFTVVYRGEDEFEDGYDENDGSSTNFFKSTNHLKVKQDISGRAFPIDFWIFLCDIAIKYSIPASYFFSKLTEKMNNCWCTSQAYINMYCIILYNLYYAINKCEHLKEDEELFSNTMNIIREKCVHLLMSQLAKPEIYQRPSITSLILLISLSSEGDNSSLNEIFKTIFLSSINNINNSIFNSLNYVESKNECNSMKLFSKITKKFEFPEGLNHLPLCNAEMESLRNAADLILYRCRSISSFYLESFLPNFANIGDDIMKDLMEISIDIADAFTKLDPIPDQKNLVYVVTIYQQLYQIFEKPQTLNPAILFNDLIEQWMFDLSQSMIELIERSIKLDNFEKKSEKSRTSDSFYEIFLFFRQGFDFITSLNFNTDEIKDKLFYFLSINSAICSTYIELLLSMASKQFRDSFNSLPSLNSQIASLSQKQPEKKKSPFPSWCPDITDLRLLSFENIAVMINNMASVRIKWFKYIVLYEKYLPNQPQIVAAAKATTERKSLKSDSSNLLLNENESSEELSDTNIETFKDPCNKLTTKVSFMLNFLRLDITYAIIGLLNNKMWDTSILNKVNIKQLKESFFTDKQNRIDQNNISTVFDQIFELFKDRIEKVKNFLQISLHLKCLPQLARGLEDGIFECMIPLAFSIKTKNVFSVLISKIEILYTDILNFIEESGFGKEIVNRCVKSFRLMPFVRNYIHLSQKEVDDQLKIEKSNFNGDYTNIILLSIVLQAVTPVPLPKAVNPSFTFISLE
ncbi:hypothetical protein M9Y10_038869 [Tritrichomonas musculus]|uniref:MHD1 domain-containing protein n=1 Tax=Tritrichomonas musculus TaxID=1915356 RepID=A0ABR2K9K6_9EUKA